MKIKLLIADDHAVVGQAIALLLSREEEIEVIGRVEDGRAALDMARDLHPDVILMDAMMPRMSGIEATYSITEEMPEIKILILSEVVNSRCMSEALTAGATGFILKSCSAEELVRAVKDVVSNGSYLTPAASSVVVGQYFRHCDTAAGARHAGLTTRQRQTLQLIAEGYTIKQIAQELALSPKTVDWHRSQIMKKLGIDTTAGLVRYAIVEGLSSTDLTPFAVG